MWDEHEGFRIVIVDGVATDVNDRGDVVGSHYGCGPEATNASCTPSGFIWSASTGLLDLDGFRPDSVDDDGEMRGSCTDDAGGVDVPCVMRDGKITALCDDADQSCILSESAPPQAPAGMLRPLRALRNAAPVPAVTADAPALVTGTQPAAAAAAAALTPTQIENAKAGTTEWKLTNRGLASGAIEGYASETSVNRGGQIKLYVNTAAPSFTMDIFRMGYYGGAGARRMLPTITKTGTKQVIPAPDALGLVDCNWVNPYLLTIPANADPTEWMSGIYLVKLTESVNKKQQYIVFAVRDDARTSDLLLAQAVNTYQAYSLWGGKSLYGTIANRSDHANGARKVSFNRPYYGEQGDGVGQFFSWELAFLQFLEREGYDVTYATNVDVDRYPGLLRSHKAFLSVGHDEYWSWRMRDNVEAARDAGVSLGFFSGNTSYWQVRYENSVATGQPFRTLVGYKSSWRDDPITPDYLKTNEFRLSPVNRSEDRMIGVMYVTQARPIFTVEDASHWIFTATGLKNGDTLKNADGTGFLGYEVDSMGPATPANAQRVGHSPVTENGANFSDMTVYRAASGATVFATGSINWSVSLPQAQQMIRNVLARFISNAFADTVPVRPALPAPFKAVDIGNTGRPGFVSLSSANGFTLNGAGQDTQSSATDALYYAHQPLSGDGEIVAQVTGLQRAFGYRSGIMIRESLDPGSKYASVVVRAAGSTTPPEGAELRVRDVLGTKPRVIASRDYKMPNWIKLARSGNVFTSWTSTDGVGWTLLGSVTIPMATNVFIGTSAASTRHGVWITARFENVNVRKSVPGGSSTPYGGTAATLPGTIEAENFDEGGMSVAYFDASAGNSGNAYRNPTDVDIQATTDTGGGYNVGWTRAGEWLKYTVSVATTGTYRLESRVANVGAGATFRVEVDGVDRSGTISVPNTGAYQAWQTMATPGIPLAAGQRVVRVVIATAGSGGAAGNFNWFRFVLESAPPSTTPYGGTPASLPGTVQMENFDVGAGGVAYYDTAAGNTGGAYRQTDVDVGTTNDPSNGGYYVGWTRAGEWLIYSVNATQARDYTLAIRVANVGSGATFRIEVDGAAVTGAIPLPDTGGWNVWQTVPVGSISLSQGAHVVRVVIVSRNTQTSGAGNYGYLVFQ